MVRTPIRTGFFQVSDGNPDPHRMDRGTLFIMIPLPETATRNPAMNIRPFECALVLSALLAVVVPAQEPQDPPRYGFDYNPILYPQKKPEDAIKSIVKAIDAKRVDYLLAQLA